MKRVLLTLVSGLFISAIVSANLSDLFNYDANLVDQELSQLQTIEDFINMNPGATLSGMQQEENSLLQNLHLTTGEFGGVVSFGGEPALGIPSFLWGCVLGPVGILIVHLVAEDSVETKKALWGCITYGAVTVVGTIVYVIVVVLLMGTTYYY